MNPLYKWEVLKRFGKGKFLSVFYVKTVILKSDCQKLSSLDGPWNIYPSDRHFFIQTSNSFCFDIMGNKSKSSRPRNRKF